MVFEVSGGLCGVDHSRIYELWRLSFGWFLGRVWWLPVWCIRGFVYFLVDSGNGGLCVLN